MSNSSSAIVIKKGANKLKKELALVVTLTLLGGLTTEAKTINYPNTKLPMSTNMPIGSFYYDYLDKLDGMGYLKSMLYGTRPVVSIFFRKLIFHPIELPA